MSLDFGECTTANREHLLVDVEEGQYFYCEYCDAIWGYEDIEPDWDLEIKGREEIQEGEQL